nr:coat protein {N-terminal, core region, domains I-III} [sugarcane mosaic virus SCMV, Isis, Peptide Partial, 83 aa] [Sugarcane mosaic virus]
GGGNAGAQPPATGAAAQGGAQPPATGAAAQPPTTQGSQPPTGGATGGGGAQTGAGETGSVTGGQRDKDVDAGTTGKITVPKLK